MRHFGTLLILVAAVINLLPVSGVISAARLEALYGIPVRDVNLLILLRHRAVLFGIVGTMLVAAAVHRPLRPVGFAVGLASMISYLLIAWSAGGYNRELGRVVTADIVGIVALLGAALLHYARPD